MNPFASKNRKPKPTAWQQVFRIVFGEGVAHLPAAPVGSKPMTKRRFRRLRGKAKASRVTVQYL